MKNITCGNISFAETDIYEVDGAQIMISIPYENIISLSFGFGESIERPIRQLMLGIACCAFGCPGAWLILDYLFHGVDTRPPFFLPIVSAATLIPIGISLILPVFRKSHYLAIKTHSGIKKITLKNCDFQEVVNAANQKGITITETAL